MLTAMRNYYLSQMLSDAGFEVHILTRPSPDLEKFRMDKPIHFHTVDAWDYRRVLKLLGFPDGVTSSVIRPGKLIEWGFKLLLTYPFNLIFGEGGGWYYRKAIKTGRSIIDKNQISIIYSSYRPITDHFIASRLKKHHPSLYWIGDFRDILWWTRSDRHYQHAWVQNLLLQMDQITAITRGIADFWALIAGRPVTTVYNGLPAIQVDDSVQNKYADRFIINYTGRIYTQFQKADCFFTALHELKNESTDFSSDLLIHYAGINKSTWDQWIKTHQLESNSISEDHQPIHASWQAQNQAQINLLLTWTTPDVWGFIHGKFNEYVAAGRPILCLIEGDRDPELEALYQPFSNSIIVLNQTDQIKAIKKYILDIYQYWKKTGQVPTIAKDIVSSYAWGIKGEPLLKLLQ